jgi:hypothetical protein
MLINKKEKNSILNIFFEQKSKLFEKEISHPSFLLHEHIGP